MLKDGFLRDQTGFSPRVNKSEPEDVRDEEEEHERQIHESGFEESARGIAPAAAGELVNHGYHEAAERQPYPKQPREKVRKLELLSIEESAESGETQSEQAEHQGGELNAIET